MVVDRAVVAHRTRPLAELFYKMISFVAAPAWLKITPRLQTLAEVRIQRQERGKCAADKHDKYISDIHAAAI